MTASRAYRVLGLAWHEERVPVLVLAAVLDQRLVLDGRLRDRAVLAGACLCTRGWPNSGWGRAGRRARRGGVRRAPFDLPLLHTVMLISRKLAISCTSNSSFQRLNTCVPEEGQRAGDRKGDRGQGRGTRKERAGMVSGALSSQRTPRPVPNRFGDGLGAANLLVVDRHLDVVAERLALVRDQCCRPARTSKCPRCQGLCDGVAGVRIILHRPLLRLGRSLASQTLMYSLRLRRICSESLCDSNPNTPRRSEPRRVWCRVRRT